MITHIRMKNFKSWQDSGAVKLAPLTGFFGTNSSGKSSLLQMLLLLKQTSECSNTDEIVFFGNENSLVNLGDFQEVVHMHNLETTLGLEFGFKIDTLLKLELSAPNDFGPEVPFPYTTNSFIFEAAILWQDDKLTMTNKPYRVKVKGRDYVIDLGDYSGKIYGKPHPIESIGNTNIISQLSSQFKKLFSHVYYLGPARVQPKRSYHWNDKDPGDVGLWGDKVIDALLCAHMRRIKISKKGKEATIEDRVSEWLREMDLAHSFSLNPVGALKDDNYEVRIQKSATSPAVTLADIGYGLADVLPMLVLCYYTPEGSTLILEQPGIHLHPKVQADLADLLIEVIAERNLQILIESHSEHLLTRLQRRIAEKNISHEDTALYFCRNKDGTSTIEPLDVNKFGEIKNWPENFFGEVMSDMFAMTDAQKERMAEQNTED